MNCQMIRVISSPSSSTTVPSTLILLTDFFSLCSCGSAAGSRRKRASGGGQWGPSSEVGHIGLLGAYGFRRLAQACQLTVGQIALDDLPHTFTADLGLAPQVHPGMTAPESSMTARAIRAAAAEGA